MESTLFPFYPLVLLSLFPVVPPFSPASVSLSVPPFSLSPSPGVSAVSALVMVSVMLDDDVVVMPSWYTSFSSGLYSKVIAVPDCWSVLSGLDTSCPFLYSFKVVE